MDDEFVELGATPREIFHGHQAGTNMICSVALVQSGISHKCPQMLLLMALGLFFFSKQTLPGNQWHTLLGL